MSSLDYLIEDKSNPKDQNYVCLSFLSDKDNKTTLTGIKVRGVFSTMEEASEHAKNLQSIDEYFNVFVGEVGKWLPYDPNPTSEKAGSAEYVQEELNNLMKGYVENQNKAKVFEEKRKVENIRKSLESQIENSNNTINEVQQQLLESADTNNTSMLNNKLKNLEKTIKEFEDKTDELKKKEVKLEKKLEKMTQNKVKLTENV